MKHPAKPPLVNFLQEFSIPLIGGVLVALLFANLAWEHYERIVHWMPFGDVKLLGHPLTLHLLVNDVFMVFFFGIATKEITESALPGGSLNPLGKALNPLFATVGGVVGPVAAFFAGLALARSLGHFEGFDPAVVRKGWGIPTATDIALAWLVARGVFGRGHPAINFLLLLAIADDAIGLGIIAIFYGDPEYPAEPVWLLLVVLGMALALGMRMLKVKRWQPYVLLAGPVSWLGLMLAHLHPALALVFIVPFLPGPRRDVGLFEEVRDDAATGRHHDDSPLHLFEHDLKLFVDFGLFFFAFTNAGVQLAGIGPMTWIILGALVVGKTVGITLLALLAVRVGFPLPDRMGLKELMMAGFVASLGLTVALFVATAAFQDPDLLGQAKMGALFSGFVGFVAVALARPLGLRPRAGGEAARDSVSAS